MHNFFGFQILCFIFLHFFAFSQENKIILLPGSEIAEYDQNTGIHRLYNNVKFLNQRNTIYCDSAIFNENTNKIRSYGNVQIQKDDINIYCDSFEYQTKKKFAKLWGHVNGRDLEYKISSDSMDYNLSTGLAIYKNKGEIESIISNEKIQSKVGYFYPKSKDFFFSGDVNYKKNDFSIHTDTLQFNYKAQTAIFYGPTQINNDSIKIFCQEGTYNVEKNTGKIINKASISNKETYITSDTIYYSSKNNEILCKGNSFLREDSLKMKVFSNIIYTSDSTKASYCQGHSIIQKVISSDTLYFKADSIGIIKDSLNKLNFIDGFKEVEIFHKDFTIIGDTGRYNYQSGIVKIRTNPIMWTNNIELKANYFNLFLNDSTIDSAYMIENCSIIAELEGGQFYNQLYGKNIAAFFEDQKLRSSIITGNAESFFYPYDEISKDSIVNKTRYGLNKLTSSKLNILLKDGEVEKINYLNSPEGSFIPMRLLNEENKFSEKFNLQSNQKPALEIPIVFKKSLRTRHN